MKTCNALAQVCQVPYKHLFNIMLYGHESLTLELVERTIVSTECKELKENEARTILTRQKRENISWKVERLMGGRPFIWWGRYVIVAGTRDITFACSKKGKKVTGCGV